LKQKRVLNVYISGGTEGKLCPHVSVLELERKRPIMRKERSTP